MLLNEEALVLRSEVVAPLTWELKLLATLDGLLKNADALSVRQMNKRRVEHALQALNQTLVDHLVKELEVVLAVVKSPTDAILDEIFLQLHQSVEVQERNLGLYHPELSEVSRSVRVLGTECRTESVDGAKSGCSQLTLELS